MIRRDRDYLPLFGVCGAFIFILSALKLPSVTGSCSHPTGTGLSTICFGVFITSIIGAIVLLFQSLLLAHGGLSTLRRQYGLYGNRVDPLAGYAVIPSPQEQIGQYLSHGISRNCHSRPRYAISLPRWNLHLHIRQEIGGIVTSFQAFFVIFAVTQVTTLPSWKDAYWALVFKYILALKPEILIRLHVFSTRSDLPCQRAGQ